MSNKASIFARLTKVNEANRTVEGVIADETPDHAGEVFDYTTSKAHFVEWSNGLAKATDGKSVGNLRAMHGNVVAGKLDAMNFDDVAKSISVVANVVDDNEWQKVLKGCYTGFSIGGSYGAKWDDAELGKKRYTGIPNEVSLVDLPCNGNATFTVTKADGSNEMRKFRTAEAGDAKDDGALGSDPSEPAFADPLTKQLPLGTDAEVRAAWAHVGTLPVDNDVRKATHAEFSKRFGAPASDAVTGDPSANAVAFDAVCAGVLAKLRAGDPYTQHFVDALQTAVKGDTLAKGMYDCSSLCSIMMDLGWAVDDACWEAKTEGDGSPVPAQLVGVLRSLGDALVAMVSEETREMVTRAAANAPLSTLALAKPNDGLTKSAPIEGEPMAKVLEYTTAMRKALNLPDDFSGSLVDEVTQCMAKAVKAEDALGKAHVAIHEQNAGLLKLRNENTALAKRVDEQAQEIAKLKATPPEKNTPMLKAVGKDGVVDEVDPSGTGGGSSDVRNSDGEVDPVASAIKKAHQGGGRPLMKR